MGTDRVHGVEHVIEPQDLEKLPAKVTKIVVDGVQRTKDDFLAQKLSHILKTDNFISMVKACEDAKHDLERLSVFSSVDIHIDITKGQKAVPNSYDVNFRVHEKRRFGGGIQTVFGDNKASLITSVKLPNTFGRAEEVSAEYNRNTSNDTGGVLRFSKPLNGNPKVRFTAAGYKGVAEYPWSGFKEACRGVTLDVVFPSAFGTHCLKWDGVWRDVQALSRTTAFAVREQSGHSLKSSVKHLFTMDGRDNPVLPNDGVLFRMEQEFAGLGGNVEYLKHDMELQMNKTTVFDTVLQVTLAGGVMRTLNGNGDIRINDKFFLGGPLTLRGFNLKGVGPHSDGSALGADAYWIAGLHMYTPLPFRPGKGGFGELFRTHFFVNVGNIGNLQVDKTIRENFHEMSDTFRLAYGAGIVLKMGRIARMELNYVWPVRVQKGDSVNAGLQFGIGMTFL